MGESYDAEIQVIYESVSGTMRQQAILSFLIKGSPGKINPLLSNFNVMRVPGMEFTQVNDFIIESFNIINILFTDDQIQSNIPPFSYYKYMGSMTSPPCEEYVVHFVVAKPIETSTTLLTMMRDALDYPEESPVPK